MQIRLSGETLTYLPKIIDMSSLRVGQKLPVEVVSTNASGSALVKLGGQEMEAQLDTAARPGDRFWVSVRELSENSLVLSRGQNIPSDLNISPQHMLTLMARGLPLDPEISSILDRFQNNPQQMVSSLRNILDKFQNPEIRDALAQFLRTVPQWENLSSQSVINYLKSLGVQYENQLLGRMAGDSNDAASRPAASAEGQSGISGRPQEGMLAEKGNAQINDNAANKGSAAPSDPAGRSPVQNPLTQGQLQTPQQGSQQTAQTLPQGQLQATQEQAQQSQMQSQTQNQTQGQTQGQNPVPGGPPLPDSQSGQLPSGRVSEQGPGQPNQMSQTGNAQQTGPQSAAESQPGAAGTQQGKAPGAQPPASGGQPGTSSASNGQVPAEAQANNPAMNHAGKAQTAGQHGMPALRGEAGADPSAVQMTRAAEVNDNLKAKLIRLLEASGQNLTPSERGMAKMLLDDITAQQLWLQAGLRKNAFVLMNVPLQDQEGLYQARIAIESGRKGSKMDARHCRIAVQVDTNHLGTVGADVWLYEDRLHLCLLSDDTEGLTGIVQSELASAQEHFQALGILLASVTTKDFADMPRFKSFLAGEQLEINIEG